MFKHIHYHTYQSLHSCRVSVEILCSVWALQQTVPVFFVLSPELPDCHHAAE